MSKLVSVIIGIYNVEKTLAEALDCIVNQTYTDWEVIMCDDGSTDNTVAVANEYVNKYPGKFILIKNEQNMGLNFTLNKCLKEAKGEYIARMDGDDLCDLDRFEIQVKILDENPDIAIVSSDMSFFDESGTWGYTNTLEYPTKNDYVLANSHCHAAAMVRKEAYDAVDGYTVDKRLLRVEDYHLWCKMCSKGYKGINIKKPLYHMRDDQNARKRRKFKYRINEAYAHIIAGRMLHAPLRIRLRFIVPILKGLVPGFVYSFLHKKRLNNNKS